MGACGLAIAIAQKMSFVRGLVVENQCSVQRTARRDRTTSFFVSLRTFFEHIRHSLPHRAQRTEMAIESTSEKCLRSVTTVRSQISTVCYRYAIAVWNVWGVRFNWPRRNARMNLTNELGVDMVHVNPYRLSSQLRAAWRAIPPLHCNPTMLVSRKGVGRE